MIDKLFGDSIAVSPGFLAIFLEAGLPSIFQYIFFFVSFVLVVIRTYKAILELRKHFRDNHHD